MPRMILYLTVLVLSVAAPAIVQCAPPIAPLTFEDTFQGALFFDDAVGVVHVRQSKSTAETDYAPGIAASKGKFYARLTVQPTNNINGSQTNGTCAPGAAESDNSFSCGGPFTEWGLPYGGFDGQFDTGIPIGPFGAVTYIDIYLDTAFAAAARATNGTKDYRFDWDSDLLDSKGKFLQDYIFNVATGQSTDSCAPSNATEGFYVVEASTNSQRGGANAHNPTPPNGPQACITKSGWYTFAHFFTPDYGGNLVVQMIITQGYNIEAAWTVHPTCMGEQVTENLCTLGSPVPFHAVGSNFLGWFPDQEINDLAVDNIARTPLY